jgi:hypothetical protein
MVNDLFVLQPDHHFVEVDPLDILKQEELFSLQLVQSSSIFTTS